MSINCDAIIDIDVDDIDVDIINSVRGKCALMQATDDFENIDDRPSLFVYADEDVTDRTLVCNLDDDVAGVGDNLLLRAVADVIAL